jgi:AhpD family alkylhydroperoxidase
MTDPRLPPLPEPEWDADLRELVEQNWSGPPPGNRNNLFRTLARHRELLRAWGSFGRTVLNGRLPPRERELLVLRVAWVTRCAFEWAYHEPLARRVGLTDAEIRAITVGRADPAWDEPDVALLTAADELEQTSTISDATWAALRSRYDDEQLLEIVTVVGQYRLVAGITNAARIAPAPGLPGLPAH